MKSAINKGCRRVRTVSYACVAVLGIVVSAHAQDVDRPVPSIVTTGEAIVRRAPDRVYVTASVETRAKNPGDAQRQNAETMSAVQKAIRRASISNEAVRTLGYSIEQEVDYVNGRRVLRDYLARNAIEVRLDRVERTGEILDLVTQAGATTISHVRFDLQDRTAVERDAVRLAVVDARGKAEAMAVGAGRSLGDILRIEEASQVAMPPRPMMAFAREAAADQAVQTPVAAGEIEIRAQVTFTVEIR